MESPEKTEEEQDPDLNYVNYGVEIYLRLHRHFFPNILH